LPSSRNRPTRPQKNHPRRNRAHPERPIRISSAATFSSGRLSVDRAQSPVTRLALIDDQVEAWRSLIAENAADERVSLPTMVRLVIEKMIECGSEGLLDVLRIDESPISEDR